MVVAAEKPECQRVPPPPPSEPCEETAGPVLLLQPVPFPGGSGGKGHPEPTRRHRVNRKLPPLKGEIRI